MSDVICTFNANNLYARYRFQATYPGDRSNQSFAGEEWGYLPLYGEGRIELFNEEQRKLTAAALSDKFTCFPDVICLQEVESLLALRMFNEQYLQKHYPYAVLIDSRDFRQIDVAVLSKLEITRVCTHVDHLDPQPDDPKRPWLFSRDCLEVEVALGGSGARTLTLFINHLKSKYAESKADRVQGNALRERQAQAVLDIVRERFGGNAFNREFFAVLGDLNDEPGSPPVKPLTQDSGLVDALLRIPREEERWTHWYASENTVSQLDHMLLSPALAAHTGNTPPRIERRGVGFSRVLTNGQPGPKTTHFQRVEEDPNPVPVPFQFPRFPEVTPKVRASDHCPLLLEIP